MKTAADSAAVFNCSQIYIRLVMDAAADCANFLNCDRMAK